MRNLQGKVGVVVGAATGIGAASAVRLAEEGVKVVVADLNMAAAAKTVERIRSSGGTATALHVDVNDEETVAALFRRAAEEYGRIDAVHANAANLGLIARDGNALTLSYEIFEQTMRTNLYGYILCTRYAIPLLAQAGGGSIIYTSSAASFGGPGDLLAYSISKAGVNNLVRHVASGWAKEGVRAYAIAPGFVLTENARANVAQSVQDAALSQSRSGFHGLPEDIASSVAFLMSEDARWINGQVVSVDGGMIMR